MKEVYVWFSNIIYLILNNTPNSQIITRFGFRDGIGICTIIIQCLNQSRCVRSVPILQYRTIVRNQIPL